MYEISAGNKFAEEDSYQDGCLPHTGFDVVYDVKFCAPTIDELVKLLCDHFDVDVEDIELDACDEPGRIDVRRLETEDADKPSEAQLFEWKKGRLRLWAATYSFYCERVERKTIRLTSEAKMEGVDR